MHAGAGDSTKYTPSHLIADREQDMCTVPAKHILTASNTTGKVGTNHSALKLPAVQLLSEFEKSWSSPYEDKIIRKAEQYLLKVLTTNSAYFTINDLGYEIYHKTKVKVSNFQELAEREPKSCPQNQSGDEVLRTRTTNRQDTKRTYGKLREKLF